jgi:signal transduction histidine kinase
MTHRSRSGKAAATEVSIQAALRGYMQHAPRPFAITVGAKHNLVYVNAAFSRLIGVDNGDALGAPMGRTLTVTEREALSPLLDRAFRDGVELLDERIDTGDERAAGWRFSVWPVIADDGRTEALGVEIRETVPSDDALDLQRKIAEQMLLSALRERGFADDAEAARRRAAFLAEAGRVLAESVDQSSTLLALTRLALPAIGAWCIVDILEEDDSIRRLAIYHPDPDKQKIVRELEASWAPESDDPFGGPAMLRSARTTAITDFMDATLAVSAHSPRNLILLRQLGIGSFLTVPLLARKRLLGAITFVSAQRGLPYSPEDVQLAEDVANRGALALDSAQVYDLALVLQRSAETANRAKTAFLGAMSHELRTPLNAIGGYIDIVDMGLRGPVTASQHAAFARVKTNQQHLVLLITEILNFSRAESGELAYAVTDVKACEAVQHTIELIEPLFGQKGIVFDGITGDSKIVALADPERVTQILINLLSNAIKFTPAGGHIGAECGATTETVFIRINDTGIGIVAEKHESIFEPFIQLRESLSDRESGVGLGLAISRDLARAMNGDLTVESSERNGARFTLSLPRGFGASTPSAPRL